MSTLNKMTKADLIKHAAAQGQEIAKLREQLSIAQAQPTRAARTVDWPTAGEVQAPRAPRTLPAHFVAAREAAMRLGRTVKVTA